MAAILAAQRIVSFRNVPYIRHPHPNRLHSLQDISALATDIRTQFQRCDAISCRLTPDRAQRSGATDDLPGSRIDGVIERGAEGVRLPENSLACRVKLGTARKAIPLNTE